MCLGSIEISYVFLHLVYMFMLNKFELIQCIIRLASFTNPIAPFSESVNLARSIISLVF